MAIKRPSERSPRRSFTFRSRSFPSLWREAPKREKEKKGKRKKIRARHPPIFQPAFTTAITRDFGYCRLRRYARSAINSLYPRPGEMRSRRSREEDGRGWPFPLDFIRLKANESRFLSSRSRVSSGGGEGTRRPRKHGRAFELVSRSRGSLKRALH